MGFRERFAGLGAAGFALFDETQEAPRWIGLALDKFRRTIEALGPDGASHEGAGYWEYGAEYMLKFMHLADDLLGVDLYDRSWWRNTALYDPTTGTAPTQVLTDVGSVSLTLSDHPVIIEME